MPQIVTEGAGPSFTHTQTTPINEWVIAHAMKKHPTVVIVASPSHLTINATVTYLDNNTLRLNFLTPTAGTAYLE